MNAWFLLMLASVIEIIFAITLKASDGFTKPLPTIVAIVSALTGMYILSVALKTIPLGSGYAIWTGLGAIGATSLGIFLFGESKDVLRIAFILLILVGVIGLRVVSAKP